MPKLAGYDKLGRKQHAPQMDHRHSQGVYASAGINRANCLKRGCSHRYSIAEGPRNQANSSGIPGRRPRELGVPSAGTSKAQASRPQPNGIALNLPHCRACLCLTRGHFAPKYPLAVEPIGWPHAPEPPANNDNSQRGIQPRRGLLCSGTVSQDEVMLRGPDLEQDHAKRRRGKTEPRS